MRKLLLAFILLFAVSAQGQTIQRPLTKVSKRPFSNKMDTLYLDKDGIYYINQKTFIKKYGSIDKITSIHQPFMIAEESPKEIPVKINTYRLKPTNVIVGASIIGVSIAGYTIGTSILEDKAKNATSLKSVENIQKQKSTLGYISGASSLVGVIVILTGIQKDEAGIKVSDNLYFNTKDNGAGMTMKF